MDGFDKLAAGEAGAIDALTGREIEVLKLAGTGLSRKGIAQALGISSGTVKWHLQNSYHKLGAGSREEALRRARDQNLIQPSLVCPVCACRLNLHVWPAPGELVQQRH